MHSPCVHGKRPEVEVKLSSPLLSTLLVYFETVLFNLMLTSKTEASLFSQTYLACYVGAGFHSV